MNNREAHFYLEELQRMMTQHRGIFSEEFVCANGMAIQALEKEQEQRWIPCSERYPEPDERVLVTDGYCYYVWDCMSNRAEGYFWEDESGYYHNKYDVVAWMPLPEPYKEEQE